MKPSEPPEVEILHYQCPFLKETFSAARSFYSLLILVSVWGS